MHSTTTLTIVSTAIVENQSLEALMALNQSLDQVIHSHLLEHAPDSALMVDICGQAIEQLESVYQEDMLICGINRRTVPVGRGKKITPTGRLVAHKKALDFKAAASFFRSRGLDVKEVKDTVLTVNMPLSIDFQWLLDVYVAAVRQILMKDVSKAANYEVIKSQKRALENLVDYMKMIERRYRLYTNVAIEFKTTVPDEQLDRVIIKGSSGREFITKLVEHAFKYQQGDVDLEPSNNHQLMLKGYHNGELVANRAARILHSVVSVSITIFNTSRMTAHHAKTIKGSSDGLFSRLVKQGWMIVSPQTRTLCGPFCVALASAFRDESIALETVYQRTMDKSKAIAKRYEIVDGCSVDQLSKIADDYSLDILFSEEALTWAIDQELSDCYLLVSKEHAMLCLPPSDRAKAIFDLLKRHTQEK